MQLSKREITRTINAIEKKPLAKKPIPFSILSTNANSLPKEAGIYAIYDKNKLCYIGETADLKDRLSKDLKRTYNHSFRRKLGTKKFNTTLRNGKNKFDENIEVKLDSYFQKYISISFIEVSFGRLEVETHLMHKYPNLLNSLKKRGIKK